MNAPRTATQPMPATERLPADRAPIDVSTDDGWNEALGLARAAISTECARLARAYLGLVDLHTKTAVQLETERSRVREMDVHLGRAVNDAQRHRNEATLYRAKADDGRARETSLKAKIRDLETSIATIQGANARQLDGVRAQLAFTNGRADAAEAELGAERNRHQGTALLLEAAGVEHSPRAGTAIALDAYELETPTVDLGPATPGARLAMHARQCQSLAVMADALTEPDRSVLDDCLDEPAVDRVATVQEVRT